MGVHSTVEQLPQSTTVCEWLKTVVMLKQPWHLTSMKNELGDCTKLWVFSECVLGGSSGRGGAAAEG